MPGPETHFLAPLLGPLHAAEIPYMITGGTAAIIYGEPRLTLDVDLVIALNPTSISRLITALPESEFYVPPVETLREEMNRESRGHFNLIHHATGLRADCYLMGHDPLHLWAWPRRRSLDLEGLSAWVACPEYVILRKLEFHREGGSEKHLRDIARMRDLRTLPWDDESMASWIKELKLQKSWDLACSYK